jgi:hypothetical protein
MSSVLCYTAPSALEKDLPRGEMFWQYHGRKWCFVYTSMSRGASAAKVHLWIDRDTEIFGLC